MINSTVENTRLRVFTWHIHGSYLYYLSQGNYDIYIPVNKQKNEGYYGRGTTFPFGSNVIEVPAEEVRNREFDCILFQTNKNFLIDQYEILSDEQRRLPRLYLEHDPPAKHPTDTRHIMNDPAVCLVHVTHYNKLMWQNDVPMVRVIDHGILPVDVPYTGELQKGVVVVNHLHQRGRRLGADIFEEVSKRVPLDLVGMGTEAYGGLGEVLHPQLPAFLSKYRFVFNPIRYTSLGLAVLEAMLQGIPMVALATTEYVTVIRDGYSGFIHTDIDYLVAQMQRLLNDQALAAAIGQRGKAVVEERFHISRFTKEWEALFHYTINNSKNWLTYEKETGLYQ